MAMSVAGVADSNTHVWPLLLAWAPKHGLQHGSWVPQVRVLGESEGGGKGEGEREREKERQTETDRDRKRNGGKDREAERQEGSTRWEGQRKPSRGCMSFMILSWKSLNSASRVLCSLAASP